jgi:chromosome segregation and condensation protein ScpB
MEAPHAKPLSRTESLVLTAIGYFQPIPRGELSQLFGKEISRDVIGQLRGLRFIAAGPRSPQPGAPYTYITTKQFLAHFGSDTLRDPPGHGAARGGRFAQQNRRGSPARL